MKQGTQLFPKSEEKKLSKQQRLILIKMQGHGWTSSLDLHGDNPTFSESASLSRSLRRLEARKLIVRLRPGLFSLTRRGKKLAPWMLGEEKEGTEMNERYKDAQWLKEQCDKGLSLSQIAEISDCPKPIIQMWMEHFNIQIEVLRKTWTVPECPDWNFPGWRVAKKVWSDYCSNARRKEYSFELTHEQFLNLITGDCFYCGAPPQNNTRVIGNQDKSFAYNGIDRKDSNKGYTMILDAVEVSKCSLLSKEEAEVMGGYIP